ncbi:MAG: hypothetical protein EOO73_11800 [Myxococcales bacterium]|nr:MAG: hypothetical protein EOO73_11800 [Myxococcales bacterium]
MASEKLSLEADSIQSQVKNAVREVVSDAEHVRLVVQSVESEASAVFADCAVDELRRVAAVVRTHTVGMLMAAARMACRAERLETIADVRELASATVLE